MRDWFASSSVRSAQRTDDGSRVVGSLRRPRVLRPLVLCLLALIQVRAAAASNEQGNQIGRQSADARGWYAPEISATLSLPLAAGSAARREIGLGAGLSLTAKTSPIVGMGARFGYFYWPVSAAFKRQFNEVLRDQTLHLVELGAGTWGLRAVQFGWNIRIGTHGTRGVRPWLQVVPSLFRVDPNTSGYSGDAGFGTVVAAPLKHTLHVGCTVSAGAHLFGERHSRVGLDADYHFVNCDKSYGEDLHVFMLGAHASLGR